MERDSSRTYLNLGQGVSQQPPSNPQIPVLHWSIFVMPPHPPPGPEDLVYNYFGLPLLFLWQRSSGSFTHSIFIYSAPGQARKWQGSGGRQRCWEPSFHRIRNLGDHYRARDLPGSWDQLTAVSRSGERLPSRRTTAKGQEGKFSEVLGALGPLLPEG